MRPVSPLTHAEGYMGMALAGGIAAVAVTAAFALFRGQQRR